MKTFLVALLLSTAALLGQSRFTDNDFISTQLYPAVGLLYAQTEDGGMSMRCTITMIEKDATGYIAASAAHCAAKDDEQHERVTIDKVPFFVTFDEEAAKTFIPIKVLFCGFQHKGDDACLFQVDTLLVVPVVPLGIDPQGHFAEEVVNVASPLGLGKQVFRGTGSSPKLSRPVKEGDINWENAVLLQMPGTNGGSSGSAIICMSQRAVCAFLVGSIGETEIVAVPVSRLIKLRKAITDKKYKYWTDESVQ